MTREEAKELMPFIQAFAEGKTVEFLNNDGMWEENKSPLFCSEPKRYRIKPEPKYRPFKSKEECWLEMQKHQPFGWIKVKKGGYFCFTMVLDDCSYDDLFKTSTFADGTPFGVKVEE